MTSRSIHFPDAFPKREKPKPRPRLPPPPFLTFPALHLFHKTPTNSEQRTLAVWRSPATAENLQAFMDDYTAALEPGGRFSYVYDNLGFRPYPHRAELHAGARLLATWLPGRVTSIRR